MFIIVVLQIACVDFSVDLLVYNWCQGLNVFYAVKYEIFEKCFCRSLTAKQSAEFSTCCYCKLIHISAENVYCRSLSLMHLVQCDAHLCSWNWHLQHLEILYIYWNLKSLLEILEISWNLTAPPGNFYTIDRWLFSCGPIIGKMASPVC